MGEERGHQLEWVMVDKKKQKKTKKQPNKQTNKQTKKEHSWTGKET